MFFLKKITLIHSKDQEQPTQEPIHLKSPCKNPDRAQKTVSLADLKQLFIGITGFPSRRKPKGLNISPMLQNSLKDKQVCF
jgi:hypothetical protein